MGRWDPVGSGPQEDKVLGLIPFPGPLETVWTRMSPVRRDTVLGLRFPVLSRVLTTRTPARCSNGIGRYDLSAMPPLGTQTQGRVEAVGFRMTYPLPVCPLLSLGTCWTSTRSPSPTPVGGTRVGWEWGTWCAGATEQQGGGARNDLTSFPPRPRRQWWCFTRRPGPARSGGR